MTTSDPKPPEARRIEVDRGAAIELRLFAPAAGAAVGAVLIGGAMGVRQSFYRPFAQWLADQGYVVATFDYRGVGDSRGPSLRGFEADLFAWARDTDAAIDALVDRAGDAAALRHRPQPGGAAAGAAQAPRPHRRPGVDRRRQRLLARQRAGPEALRALFLARAGALGDRALRLLSRERG